MPAPTCCSASAPRSRSTRSPGSPSSRSLAGGSLAIVTQSSTPYDSAAAVRLDGDVAEDLTAVLAAIAVESLAFGYIFDGSGDET